MNHMEIDLECFSDVDLNKAGVYRYADSDQFQILLFGVSVDDGPVHVYDLANGDEVPESILLALTDPSVIKWSFNVNFERVCISTWLRREHPFYFKGYGDPEDSVSNYLNPISWHCSMVWCLYNGLPGSLEKAGAVLGFDKQKLKEGKDLIRYFCVPCQPTKANGGRIRNMPWDAPEKWKRFCFYNQRDVEVEMQIQKRLRHYPVPDSVWNEFYIDQKINDRGIRIDRRLMDNAIRIDAIVKDDLMKRMKNLTGLENPNSVKQLSGWLEEQGFPLPSLGKKDVQEALKTATGDVKEVLQLRLMLAKSSVKKYQAMVNSVCKDGRCHGMFQFYGANRSGRWAGRILQLQNLYRNNMPDLDEARNMVKAGDYNKLAARYDNIPDVLSQLIRTALIPKEGYKFIVSDYSAIEARVIAYLAGEKWKSEAFANGEDIYCSTASRMFGVPVKKHGVNGELRAKGKVAELACGYGGSSGALIAMGALENGLSEEELPGIVKAWRSSNSQIVEYWWKVDAAVKKAVEDHESTTIGSITFFWKSGMLFITLPSGRNLAYVQPKIAMNRFGSLSVTYMGLDSSKHWSRIESYGPKFVENIVQAVSRDVLCNAMKNLSDRYIVAHIHDELVVEVPEDTPLEAITVPMSQAPDWLPGIVLNAAGYECHYYMKD